MIFDGFVIDLCAIEVYGSTLSSIHPNKNAFHPQLMSLTDKQAFSLLCELRWASESLVTCPKCGCPHSAYFIESCQQWRCKVKGCRHTFSVTSGTIFANRKLPIQTYLLSIVLFVNAVKGIPALQLSRDLGVQYKTAYVLAQKLRKSLLEQREIRQFSDLVEIDGTYVHPAPRKENKKTDPLDYRLKENQSPIKRCVIVAREHYTEAVKWFKPPFCSLKQPTFFILPCNRISRHSTIPLLYNCLNARPTAHCISRVFLSYLLFPSNSKMIPVSSTKLCQ